MSNNTRFKIARFALFGSLFMLCCAAWAIDSDNLLIAVPVIAVAIAICLVSAPMYYMYKDHRHSNKSQDQIARETLQKLEKKK